MPRRPSLSCRQFHHLHAEYVDGYLCEEQTQAMRAHGDACPACSQLDVRVRRSLLALQTLPVIEPSADFRERLHRRLVLSQRTERMPMPMPARTSTHGIRWGLAGIVTAASVAFLVLAAPARTTTPGTTGPALARAPGPAASLATVATVAAVVSAAPAAAVASAEPMASKPVPPARVAPMRDAAGPDESFRFEALPGVTAVRRSPSILSSPSVRLQLASFTGQ